MTDPIRILRKETKVACGWGLVEQHSSKNSPKAKVECLLVRHWIGLNNKRVNKKTVSEAAPWVMLPPRALSRVWTQLFYSLFYVTLVFCCSCFGFLAPVLPSSCQSTFILAAFSGGRLSFFFLHLCPSSIGSCQAQRQQQWFAKLVRGDELRMFKWRPDTPVPPPRSPTYLKQTNKQ